MEAFNSYHGDECKKAAEYAMQIYCFDWNLIDIINFILAEIDGVLKKVKEGVAVFDDISGKVTFDEWSYQLDQGEVKITLIF